MKIAVLPLNAAEGTPPALGRQFSNFACDTLRAAVADADVNMVNFLAQLDGDNAGRAAFVNVSDKLFEDEWIERFFGEAQTDKVMDGLLRQEGDSYSMVLRFHERGNKEPIVVQELKFGPSEVFGVLHGVIKSLAEQAGAALPAELAESMDFGTDSPDAFLKFLEGYDSLMYLNQAQGRVAIEFTPLPAFQLLLDACQIDEDFLGPYEACVQLCRACVAFRVGTFEAVEAALAKLQAIAPTDFRAYYAMGEAYEAVGNANKAADAFEKALQFEEGEPGIYSKLGMSQMALGMPVNAERNFRKAVELEGEDKPSMDLLAGVLTGTGRAHEVPALWKELADQHPQNAQAHAKYAISLLQAGREDDAIQAFEHGLEVLEENSVVKRFYAPVLAQKDELDRAMDFYEDVLDVAPTEIQVLLEYAQTLQKAGREFEIPKVLNNVLAAGPDPNTRAQTQAWLIELEQPQRAKAVDTAREKMEANDYEGAVRDLKPLRNWLADYWKMWAILSSAHNHLKQYAEAEEASKRLLELFPGCEPAYGELVDSLTGQDRAEEAYTIMRMAAGHMPQSLAVHVNLARAARRAGHADEARAIAKQLREAVGTEHPDLEPILAEIEG